MQKKISRKSFLGKTALATTALALGIPYLSKAFSDIGVPAALRVPLPPNTVSGFAATSDFTTSTADQEMPDPLKTMSKFDETPALHISAFSKHLQFLNYDETAEAASGIGFDGVDWSVRPKGHVLPENVEQDLPLAVDALKKVGMAPVLMTTGITTVADQHTENVLTTANKLGFKYYRLGYYKYDDKSTIPDEIERIKKDLRALALLNKKYTVKGAFQNHAGTYVGASIWEIWELLKDLPDNSLGCQYDIRHASVEGAQSWPTGLRLIEPKINTIVLKDYKWQQENGTWKLLNVPIGKGMVDFPAYFKLLKTYNINVPVSMHYEYNLGGAEHGDRKITISQKEVFQNMKTDLDKVRELWRNA